MDSPAAPSSDAAPPPLFLLHSDSSQLDTLASRYPAVRALKRNFVTTIQHLSQAHETISSLLTELRTLREERSALRTVKHNFEIAAQTPAQANGTNTGLPAEGNNPRKEHRASSAPNRRKPPSRKRTGERPAELPFSVLWFLSDIRRDPKFTSLSNPSRPNMVKCIRNRDGSQLSKDDAAAVFSTVRFVYHNRLEGLSGATPDRPASLTHLQEFHSKALEDGVRELELKQPVVALCASHWKAYHLFRGQIQSRIRSLNKAKKMTEASTATQPLSASSSDVSAPVVANNLISTRLSTLPSSSSPAMAPPPLLTLNALPLPAPPLARLCEPPVVDKRKAVDSGTASDINERPVKQSRLIAARWNTS